MSTFDHHPPMLLISTGKNGIWRLYNVMNDRIFDLKLKLSNKRFCGSSKGWLIAMDKSFTVTLTNPFVRAKGGRMKENSIIRLPPLIPQDPDDLVGWAHAPNYFLLKATLSADPILDANNCIVLIIYEDQCQMAFIRLNKDPTWTYVYQHWNGIEEVVHVEDSFYAVTIRNYLIGFDITSQSNSDEKLVAKRRAPDHPQKTYLVNPNEKELWMVHKHIDIEDDKTQVTYEFKIFELDYEKGKWSAKKTLGDVALFLGDNSSISVLASKFPGCQPNCIYFSHDDTRVAHDVGPHGPHDFGVYNVASGSFHFGVFNITSESGTCIRKLIKKSRSPPIWVVPKIQL
ncbi:PREDICTED: F-box [Prunus dulcis]|uniref:PREDICTED: F-box n=2 Tax=Prunus dulcis TaxID=3755 RepID=A0A5E4EPL0_PRUDU|nr:PREDICTED: F-box [Prunus dulcis]